MSSSISVKPRKLLAEDTVNSSKTESIKESALNSREVGWSEALAAKRLVSSGGKRKSVRRETQGYWVVEILWEASWLIQGKSKDINS